MGRPATGSTWQDKSGRRYLGFTLSGQKKHWPLPEGTNEADAQIRRKFVAGLLAILRKHHALRLADNICARAALDDGSGLDGILSAVSRLDDGSAKVKKPVSRAFPEMHGHPTFKQLADLWTSGALHRQFPDDVLDSDHRDNIYRLNKHIFPFMFDGQKVENLPLPEFTIDVADAIANAIPTRGTRKKVKQIIRYLMNKATYPCRFIAQSPIPPGWVPKDGKTPKGAFLYPSECDLLLQCKRIPLVRRLCLGLAVHEGPRRSKILSLRWNQIEPSVADPSKLKLSLPGKPNKPGASFLLNDGTAEALRRWKTICTSKKWVFPAEMVPGSRRTNRGKHMVWGDSAASLRKALGWAGIQRTSLVDPPEGHARLVAHDLRATYVTLARLRGELDESIMRRTGHTQRNTLERYDHAFGEMKELQELGKTFELTPLCDAIPELAEMSAPQRG